MTDNIDINANIVIGECVMKLLQEGQLPDKNTLLAQLMWQAERESNDIRLLALWQARRLLQNSAKSTDVVHMFASAASDR